MARQRRARCRPNSTVRARTASSGVVRCTALRRDQEPVQPHHPPDRPRARCVPCAAASALGQFGGVVLEHEGRHFHRDVAAPGDVGAGLGETAVRGRFRCRWRISWVVRRVGGDAVCRWRMREKMVRARGVGPASAALGPVPWRRGFACGPGAEEWGAEEWFGGNDLGWVGGRAASGQSRGAPWLRVRFWGRGMGGQRNGSVETTWVGLEGGRPRAGPVASPVAPWLRLRSSGRGMGGGGMVRWKRLGLGWRASGLGPVPWRRGFACSPGAEEWGAEEWFGGNDLGWVGGRAASGQSRGAVASRAVLGQRNGGRRNGSVETTWVGLEERPRASPVAPWLRVRSWGRRMGGGEMVRWKRPGLGWRASGLGPVPWRRGFACGPGAEEWFGGNDLGWVGGRAASGQSRGAVASRAVLGQRNGGQRNGSVETTWVGLEGERPRASPVAPWLRVRSWGRGMVRWKRPGLGWRASGLASRGVRDQDQ